MRKKSIAIITFVAGLYFLLEFLLPARLPAWLGGIENPFSSCYGVVNNVLMVVGAMAFLLGPINLVRSEFRAMVQWRKGWLENVAFLVSLVLSIVATLFRMDVPDTVMATFMTRLYDVLFYGVAMAFYLSSMALVSFYIVSASHRAFRLNNLDTAVMMVSATIVLVGLTPAGDVISRLLPDWLALATVSQWILNGPNTAVQKAVLFGACGGAFVAAMRSWLSLDGRDE